MAAYLDSIKGILYLLIILSVLVVVHEWGHFIVAKYFKMRVEEFALFFGKVLIRLGVKDGTAYNIRSIPLGGFVRIAGMEPDDVSGGRPILETLRDPRNEDPETMRATLAQLDADTMAGIDAQKISPEVQRIVRGAIGPHGQLTEAGLADLQGLKHSPRLNTDEHKLLDLVLAAHARATDPELYNQKPVYQRALAIAGGPVASLLFGYLLFCVVGMTVGLATGKITNQIHLGAADMLGKGKPHPAREAGLKTGDRILAIDGTPTPDGKSMVDLIRKSPNKPLQLLVERSGERLRLTVTPYAVEVTNEKGQKEVIGRIGVVPIAARERIGPIASIRQGTLFTYAYVRSLVATLFSPAVKDTLGGPIAMGQMATAAQRVGLVMLVEMAAMLSIGFAVLNLLPIPILDGGHLLLLAVEKIRRRKLSPREFNRMQIVGMGLLALIICFVMYNDIIRTVTGRAIQ